MKCTHRRRPGTRLSEDTMKRIHYFTILVNVLFSTLYAVQIGEQAPDFTVTTYSGETFTLSAQKGKVVVLLAIGCT